MGHHIATWAFVMYLVSAGLGLLLAAVVLVRGIRRPGGLQRLDVLAILADVVAAGIVAALGWSLH